jgi:hypothetical protein
MSNARIQSQFQMHMLSEAEKKKFGDIFLDDAKKLLQRAKIEFNDQEVEKKLEKYREKYNMSGKHLAESYNPKKTLNLALKSFKASISMGNVKAKAYFKEAKNYYYEKFAEEEGFVLVRPPMELEAYIDCEEKKAISASQDIKKNLKESNTEFLDAKLLSKIHFISHWIPDSGVTPEIPIRIPSPIIQIS